MAQMFERDAPSFTEAFDPNAEPGTIPTDEDEAAPAAATTEAPAEESDEAQG
jgi:large subunit ribosomal protein L9